MSNAAAATLASLLRASTIQDHDEVLKLSNAAIKASKSDIDAHHARVVALLKLDRFDDALRAIAEGGHALEARCILEKAYALYKTGRLQEARETAESASPSEAASRSFHHLRAQIAYRAENFPDAASIYRTLAGDAADLHGDENDIKINLLAANAQLEWAGLGHQVHDHERQPSRADLDSFETAYNAACAHIARAELAKASVLLKRARDLCEASEDLSPDEKQAELLPIVVQHIYVLSQLGKDSETAALQKLVVQSEIPEAPTREVAQNNQIALAGIDSNPYLTHRIAQLADKLSGNDKLFEYQQSILRRNKYALDLQMQKFQGTDSSTNNQILSASTPTSLLDTAPLGVVSAAARTQMGKGRSAIRKILPVLEKRPNDVGLLLTIIQLYVQMRNPGPAVTILETFLQRLEAVTTADYADVRFSPGLVAAAVGLYRLQGRQNSVRAELARASAHWRSKPDCPSASLLREAGVELLRSSNPEDVTAAGAAFEKLVAQPAGGQDITAVAGLVASFATRDYAKVEPYFEKLTPVERLTAGINVQVLVDAGVCSVVAASASAATKKRAAAGEPGKERTTKRRRRKLRLPKDYEEGKQPDPERWLPLRDRSTYRPKGKKGKKRAQEATQGGVVKEEETLELVGGAGAVRVEKAISGQGGKKKKKGKK
ncbi:putative signal recognition particle protein [Rosellinia necatrix]|uniref:Signal recognition particle subunit SRP72 n=1 Tax=Rosellinia necatrix TaxID=77044 RepID=A0A1W2TQT9_ROSNE|nr:putative signal recognition particle protein [Rosellinia necatrix]